MAVWTIDQFLGLLRDDVLTFGVALGENADELGALLGATGASAASSSTSVLISRMAIAFRGLSTF